jgi:hypothetical protein
VIQLVGIFYLQETYGPKLLHTKAKRLRQSTGNNTYRSEYELSNDTLPNKLATSMVRPFRLIATQPIIQALALYQAYIYGLTFIVYATFPTLWTGRYGQSMGTSGLHYIALSVGYALGTQLIAPLNDRVYHRLKQRNQGVGKPESVSSATKKSQQTDLAQISLCCYASWSFNRDLWVILVRYVRLRLDRAVILLTSLTGWSAQAK